MLRPAEDHGALDAGQDRRRQPPRAGARQTGVAQAGGERVVPGGERLGGGRAQPGLLGAGGGRDRDQRTAGLVVGGLELVPE